MSILVYKYGLRQVSKTLGIVRIDLVREQIALAHRYRNELVEIECGRRAAIRDAESASPAVRAATLEVERLDAEVRGLVEQTKRARVIARSRKVPPPPELAEAKASRRAAQVALAAARVEARADVRVDEINNIAGALRRNARKHSGLRHGTYTLVEDAAQQSARTTPLWDGTEPMDPRFERWTGSGSIGVQIPHGITWEQLIATERTRRDVVHHLEDGDVTKHELVPDLIRIDALDEDLAWNGPHGSRRMASRTIVRMRVGAGPEDWAAWSLRMHRPLPRGALVMRAVVRLRRVGCDDRHRANAHEEWELLLTVRAPDVETRTEGATLALDLGWRAQRGAGNDLRLAMWIADGVPGELRLPEALIAELRMPDEIRSVRDVAFDAARDLCAAYLAEHPALAPRDAPWVARWRSPARLDALVRRLWGVGDVARWRRMFDRSTPADGPGSSDSTSTVPEQLQAWRYHDEHLWRWESTQRVRGLRARRECYRIWAAAMVRGGIARIVIEDFDIRPVARRPRIADDKPQKDDEQADRARSNRQLCSPHEARAALVNAARGAGIEVVRVDPAHTTHTCAICDHRCVWDQAAELRHRCEKCGVEWDQDMNAAIRILMAYRERPGGDGSPAPARRTKSLMKTDPSESRWARARRLRAEKEARIEAARKPRAEAAE